MTHQDALEMVMIEMRAEADALRDDPELLWLSRLMERWLHLLAKLR